MKITILYFFIFYTSIFTCPINAEEYVVYQYKNFKMVNKFFNKIIFPGEMHSPGEMSEEDSLKALKELSVHLLSEAVREEEYRDIVFGLESYYIQITSIVVDDIPHIFFTAYKEIYASENTKKYWFSAADGGSDFWQASMNNETQKIVVVINNEF